MRRGPDDPVIVPSRLELLDDRAVDRPAPLVGADRPALRGVLRPQSDILMANDRRQGIRDRESCTCRDKTTAAWASPLLGDRLLGSLGRSPARPARLPRRGRRRSAFPPDARILSRQPRPGRADLRAWASSLLASAATESATTLSDTSRSRAVRAASSESAAAMPLRPGGTAIVAPAAGPRRERRPGRPHRRRRGWRSASQDEVRDGAGQHHGKPAGERVA